MKARVLLVAIVFACGLCFAASASGQSCCMIGHAEEMAVYASPSFAAAHEAPLPFHYVPAIGHMISFPAGSAFGSAFLVPSEKPSRKYLLMFHEWWGLNDYIKQEAERWQKELGDVNVLAIDLFDGQVAMTADEAQKLVAAAKPDRMTAIIEGALKYVGPKAQVATIGWCFGGGWALQASLLAGSRTEATVMYYGMPELDVAKLRKLHGPVLEFFGSKDEFINQEKKRDFEVVMKKAGRSLETHTYDAVHAFANPSNPKYNKQAAADANARALAFLRKNFLDKGSSATHHVSSSE